jgi:hypothetical protein
MNTEKLKSLLRYDPDTGNLYWIAKGKGKIKKKPAGTKLHSGYIGVLIEGRRYQAHRLAWALHTGSWPTDQIDHINGVKTDNRISNLREATNAQNGKNLSLSSVNTSGVAGVCFDKETNKWRAGIKVNHKQICLGRYKTFAEAVCARKLAEIKYFGEWVRKEHEDSR